MSFGSRDGGGGPIASISFAITLVVSSESPSSEGSVPIVLMHYRDRVQVDVVGSSEMTATAASSNENVVTVTGSGSNLPMRFILEAMTDNFQAATVTVTVIDPAATEPLTYALQVSAVQSQTKRQNNP